VATKFDFNILQLGVEEDKWVISYIHGLEMAKSIEKVQYSFSSLHCQKIHNKQKALENTLIIHATCPSLSSSLVKITNLHQSQPIVVASCHGTDHPRRPWSLGLCSN
jgi:hypothetical protein